MSFDSERLAIDAGIAEYLNELAKIFSIGLEIKTMDDKVIVSTFNGNSGPNPESRIGSLPVDHSGRVVAQLEIYNLREGDSGRSVEELESIGKLVKSKLDDYYAINDLARQMLSGYNEITLYKKLGNDLLKQDQLSRSYELLLSELESALEVKKCGVFSYDNLTGNILLEAYRENGEVVPGGAIFQFKGSVFEKMGDGNRPILLGGQGLNALKAVNSNDDISYSGSLLIAPILHRKNGGKHQIDGFIFASEPASKGKSFNSIDMHLIGMFASYASMAVTFFESLESARESQQDTEKMVKELAASLSTTNNAKSEMDTMLKELMETFEALQKKSALIEQVNRISVQINSTLDLDVVFQAIADYSKNLLMVEASIVGVMEEKGGISFPAVSGLAPEKISCILNVEGYPMFEKMFRKGESFIANKVNDKKHMITEIFQCQIANFMAYPVVHKKKVVAAIIALNKRDNQEFSEADKELLQTLAGQAANAIENATLIDNIKQTQFTMMAKLAYLAEKRDPETGEHLLRMQRYCRVLAIELSTSEKYADVIDEHFINEIFVASPLHDIGKVGITDDILLKPGKLEKDEFEIMKTHAQIGAEILLGPEYLKMAEEIARFHHEKWDGTGYPNCANGEGIPISARVVAVADVYDALTSKRVYKEGFTHESAMEIIENGNGKHFDPYVVDALKSSIEEIIRISEEIR